MGKSTMLKNWLKVKTNLGLVIIVLCLRGIARCECNEDRLRMCIRGGGGTEKLVTPTLIIALILMLLMTAATTYALIIRLMSVPT